jgi:polyisoprenoid-binding protein YceI
MRLVLAFVLLSLYSLANAQVYAPVDAQSKVNFKIKNFGSTVDGTFAGLKGSITFDASNLSGAHFDVTISTATLDTGIGLRDKHLRKPDYFDVDAFPTIRFVSSKVEKSTKVNEAIVTGKLTIKKTTKEISFPFRYGEVNGVQQFTGEFKMNRRDYAVGGKSISLSDELMVQLDVKASK